MSPVAKEVLPPPPPGVPKAIRHQLINWPTHLPKHQALQNHGRLWHGGLKCGGSLASSSEQIKGF